MQEEIPRFHGILRNIRGGDEGERWGDAAFLEKSLAKNFMHGTGAGMALADAFAFFFVWCAELCCGGHFAQVWTMNPLKFLLFPSKCDLISFWKYGTIVSLDVR